MKQHGKLFLLIFIAILLNGYVVKNYPVHKTWGDEIRYMEHAHRELSFCAKITRLIPGNMYFEWWPPFAYHVYGFFSSNNLTTAYHQQSRKINPNKAWDEHIQEFFSRISMLNVLFLIIIGINIYFICLVSKYSKTIALISSALVLFTPRIVFYVQTLWPELLHLVLLTSALLLLITYEARRKILFLIGSGILFGFCALTKGIVAGYIIVLLPVIFGDTYIHASSFSGLKKKALKEAVSTTLLFYLCFLGITLPQKVSNYNRFRVWAISTNTWVNIERGLNPKHKYEHYFNASNDCRIREQLAKERTWNYVKTHSFRDIMANQLRTFVANQLNDSFLSLGFRRNRWEKLPAAAAMSVLTTFTVILSWLVFLFGIGGYLIQNYRSFGRIVLATYILYYIASLLIVGFNSRFFVQVMPFLGIFAASFIESVWNRSLLKLSTAPDQITPPQ